ncbi:MAG TPA: four helix bundle protein [Chloroflexota bacterium]|nr:four helix bundle protein [Chloroflexota bacterium]
MSRFEDLVAWQKARELTREIYLVTSSPEFRRDRSLRDQIRRASVSVVSNIAEGFERGGDREFVQFLAQARGSVGELRTQLYVALDAHFVDEHQFNRLQALALEAGRLIGGLMRYLRTSGYRGTKFREEEACYTANSGLGTRDSGLVLSG